MKPVKLVRDPVRDVYDGLAAEEVARVKAYRPPPRRFRASEAADCRRKIWYRLAGYVPTPDHPWLRLVAEAGKMYHDSVRHTMVKFGVKLTGFTNDDTGTLVEDKYVVRSFRFDRRRFDVAAQADAGMEMELEDGAKVPASIEIKSMSFFRHDKAQRAFRDGGAEAVARLLDAEHAKYVWQANTTAIVRGVKHVLLLLVGRSGYDLGLAGNAAPNPDGWPPSSPERTSGSAWEVEEQDRGNILQKFADIDRALDQGEPPPPDYTEGSYECKQCNMWIHCHGAKRRAKYPIPGVIE